MRVVIYAPTYQKSPGIRYRVDMMHEALSSRFEVTTFIDRRESVLRSAYRLMGPTMLPHRWSWERTGERISGMISEEKPDAVILVTDVTAGAIPSLRKRGITTILSIEDLTPEWLGLKDKAPVFKILESFSSQADGIIAVSESLKNRLQSLGIRSEVVPPGIRSTSITPNEAVLRVSAKPALLNSGQIQFEEELDAFRKVASSAANSYGLMSYDFGRYAEKLKAEFPGIAWYNFPSPEDAVPYLKRCPVGLIIRFRAHCPTRLFYHASMLQPIIGIGDHWTSEIESNSIGVVCNPEEVTDAMNRILGDYEAYVQATLSYVGRNSLEKAYAPLIKMLGG
jgi:hypothetical protein